MPSDVKEAPGLRARGVIAGEQVLPALDPALAKLAMHAAKIRTRRGQSIGFALDGNETAYIVRAGGRQRPAKSLPFCFRATCSEQTQCLLMPMRA